jgi:clan AA aspartic protease (TIGR02281 family)
VPIAGPFLAALLIIVAAPAVAAESVPDLATLEARIVAARGPVPSAYREVVRYRGSSSSGTEVTFVRGNDVRTIDDDGTFTTQRGTYRSIAWHQNENGQTVIAKPDPGEATVEATITTVTRASSPVDAYVIATLTAKGFGSKDYIDPQTFYELRSESIRPSGTTTTVYGPYQTYGSRHLATSWHVHSESSKTDTDYAITAFAAADLTESDVLIPGNRRTLVQFPADQNVVTLPSTFSQGRVYVRLNVNGRGLDFQLDTGASAIAINAEIARRLGLTMTNAKQNNVNAGTFETGEVVVPHVQVGSLTMDDVAMAIAPANFQAPDAPVRAVGLLGFDFFAELGVTIDYEHHIVRAAKLGTYAEPDDPQGIVLDVRLGTQTPLVTAHLDGAVAERMIFDTGASVTFLLFDYFLRRYPEAFAVYLGGDAASNSRFRGIGGTVDVRPYEIGDFRLGSQEFTDLLGYLEVSNKNYSSSSDGLIGNKFIGLFTVFVDYPNGHIHLTPNSHGRHAMGLYP